MFRMRRLAVLLIAATALPLLVVSNATAGGGFFPLFPPDLLEKSVLPNVTLDLDRQPFWAAMEQFSRKSGLEPVLAPEDPYPRFQLGLGGGFWDEPHVIAGPVRGRVSNPVLDRVEPARAAA